MSITTASTTRSLKDFFRQFAGSANLTVAPQGNDGIGIKSQVLHRLKRRDGVKIALPSTFDTTLLPAKDRDVPILIKGIDPDLERQVNNYKLVGGRFLSDAERGYNILLVNVFADRHAIHLGDEVQLTINDESVQFSVVGLLKDEGAAHLNNGNVGFVTLDMAQEIFNLGSRVDRIDLVIDPRIADEPAILEEYRVDLANELGDAYTVTSPEGTGQSVASLLSGLNTGLSIFSMVALFVGALLIYNTFAMTVQERTRELGMLRALGMTRGQVLILVFSESVVLGVIGSLLGIVAGMGLAFPLIALMAQIFGGQIQLSSYAVPAGSLMLSIILGLVTTLVASAMPAFSASRISPVEAMRSRGKGEDGFLLRHGWKIGGLLVVGWILDEVLNLQIQIMFLALFLGVTLMVPAVIVVLERWIRVPVALFYGRPGQLGSMNLERARGRASLTVGVLMVGMVMTVSIGAMSAGFNKSLLGWIEAALGADLFVESNSQVMRLELARDLAAVEGVSVVTPMRYIRVKAVGGTNSGGYQAFDQDVLMIAIDPRTYPEVSGFQFQEPKDHDAAIAALADGDAVFISNVIGEQRKLHTGDTIRLRTARGETDFLIAGVVVNFTQTGQTVMASWRDLTRYMADHRVSQFEVKLEPGYSQAVVKEEIDSGVGKKRHLEVLMGDEFRRTVVAQARSFFSIFDALVAIAIIVSALGVVNTMTMNVLERVREIGMLRGIGMTRRQVGRMILAEAAAMGFIGGLIGIVVGFPMSYRTLIGMGEATGWHFDYVFPTAAFASGIGIVLAVSQLAAVYPVWRAGRLKIVEAVQYEG
ncbi:MAG: hypothetical protein A2Z04_02665 [Chloroflexi bacterium RBG_16_57_9]|nr:MAG: hypothetical protein A2Z04_02665 [Chloroflexi bacterium RBG_16_57_9]